MSVVGKPDYRDTVGGWIPADWQMCKLGDHVSKVGSGVTPKGGSDSYLSSGVPLIRSQNVLWGSFNLSDVAYISVDQHQRMVNSALQPMDVLLNITGASIGRCAVLPKDFCEGNVNQHVCIIRPAAALEPTYLSQYLISQFGQEQISRQQAGGNREGLNFQQIRGFTIPLPPLPEQQKIAAVLTAVDDKLDVIARQIDTTKTLKQGLTQTLFSRGVGTQGADGRWVPHIDFKASELGGIPTIWSEQKASEICDVRDGTHDSPKFHECGVPFYTSKNISDGKLNSKGAKLISLADAEKFNKRSKVHRGDILMSMIGTVGEAALVDVEPDFCIKNVGMFKPNNSVVSSRYLLYFFQSPAFKAFVKTQLDGGIQKFLSLTALRALKVPLPPLQEQNEIANFLDVVTQKFELLEARQTHFITLKRGLMQKLLTGEWRVTLDVHQDAAIAA